MNLTALQHSAFLQSLGWAIANSLWQSAVLWIVYHLVNASYKNATSKFRNLLSTALLFSLFVWFLQTFLHKFFLLKDQINIKAATPDSVLYSSSVIPAWKILVNNALRNLPYLSVAYLLLLIIFSIRLINSYRNINFIKNNGLQKPSVDWRLFTDKVAMHIGITKKIKLWFSAHVDVPATLGFFKPVILIPLASVNQLSPDQLEAIILHELSHIKRNDYFINLFISIIETILFFNPFVVLLSKIIKRERENCCDDFVIQYKYDPHSYASALLSLEQSRISNLRLAISATSGKKQLLHRIKRIMGTTRSSTNFNYGQKLLALILITGIITSVAWLSPQKKERVIETVKKPAQVSAKTVWEVKLKGDQVSDQPLTKIVTVKIKKPQQASIINAGKKSNKILSPGLEEKHSMFTYNDNNTDWRQTSDDVNLFSPAPQPTAAAPVLPPVISFSRNAPGISIKNVQALKDIYKKVDLKKLQAAFEKENFSFSFDWNKWHQQFNHSIKNIQFDDFMLPGYPNISSEEIEKLVQNEMKNLKAQAARIKVPANTVHINSANLKLNKKLLILIDSIALLSAAVLDKSDQKSFRKMPQPILYRLPEATKNYTEATSTYQYQNSSEDENLKKERTLLRPTLKSKIYQYNCDCDDRVIISSGKKSTSIRETKNAPVPRSGGGTFTIHSEGNNIIEIRIEE